MKTLALRLQAPHRLVAAVATLLLLTPGIVRAGNHRTTSSSANGYVVGDDSDFGWWIYDPVEGSSTRDTDGDSWEDVAGSLRNEKSPVFWFELDGARYVVRDAETVARAQEIVQPMRALGKRQGALGAKQGRLGARQSELGMQQARLGARQALLGQRLAALVSADVRDGGDSRRRERRAIEAEMNELGARQGELGRQQGPLGEIQGDLGRQQGELGRQQAEMARIAGEDLKKLAEESLRDHTAEPLRARRRASL